ncbi:transformation/transcription domain-associated protein isoform X2 [Cloeon dipterum]|uniref:transformation/transcription domain-associated protein isoform X2 n=1 Tax=Cloeon dipterum TaxID=197152 RepID=UPI00321FC6B7
MATVKSAGTTEPMTQMSHYRSYVNMLADPNAKDELKLKVAQELSENYEVIVSSPQYASFLEHSIKIFIKILSEGEPHFIAEYNIQQVRKLILEMIHRLPTGDPLRIHVKPLISLMFKLLEVENEENVLIALRIIIELHKQYRPGFGPEIQHFLSFVKSIYLNLPNHLDKIFEPKPTLRVKELAEINLEPHLAETYTVTPITSEKKTPDGTPITYNLIPKAIHSLKVLQELPIIVVLMYQLYKNNVQKEVEEFVPVIMSTVTLAPAQHHQDNPLFNKEVFVDFMGAQIKTLSFLAYVVRIYQETVSQHSNLLVQGVLGLLTLCPPEVTHQRKELLVAARHILSTELRVKFVPFLDQLFEERILLGGGWTAHETLRPLAYSTLADLVHHVRHLLPVKHLASAVHLFSKNVHDESLPTNIQTMSCKLLLNLVDLLRQRSESEGNVALGRQIMMRMLEVFVLKFKTIVKLHLPVLVNKLKQPKEEMKVADTKDIEKSKFGFPPTQAPNYNVADCRSLVKTLVCGAKTITWGCATCKNPTGGPKFQAKETLIFIKLVKWALQALDIYTLGSAPTNPMQARATALQTVRSKEEREVLEHFAGVFTMMDSQTFQEIFSTSIDYMVNRIAKNSALQIIGNTFLSNPSTSPIFATVLVEYLLERMDEMGCNIEKSSLYLRLFKLVFGCVSLFPAENEQMLKPHLHQIVNRAMELALSAKEPYNYFLLLRALFRSIGGGSHDLLYQEFLPLLPHLLQGLNGLQSSLHKQHMKDLFVELCLTVPVRLSSLLPYLPMLMDPLVSALNGSHTLISQGLRTLELCVDNLQPDFLYEHIQPVRADLMQALWRTLRNPADQVANVAFRVLGKFGGGNRKMMIEPQKLEFKPSDTNDPCIVAHFPECKTSIALPVSKIIETALNVIRCNTNDPFYRKQSWECVKCYIVASLNLDDEQIALGKYLMLPSFTETKIPSQGASPFTSPDKEARKTLQNALTAMFVAAAIKDLRPQVLPFMVAIVRHLTLVAVAQEVGPQRRQTTGMDPLVLIDALAVIMGHEEKELVKPGNLALILIIESSATVLGGKERASQLSFMQYLADKMCNLCYERAWFAKVGGCVSIKAMVHRMCLKWVYEHLFMFLRALLFVMMDLTGEVSNGAVDVAKNLLERMLTTCVAPPPLEHKDREELLAVQKKSLYEVTHELTRQVTSPNTLVRQQAMHLLKLLADLQGMTVTAVLEPHKNILQDIIPPRRHLLRHQPSHAQIGLMDGNTFCTTLEPRLFTIDVAIEEHKTFIKDVIFICEQDDASLQKNPCYKSLSNLVTIRKSAMRALAACHYIPAQRDEIFTVLYKALERPNAELQETAFECMKQFISGCQVDIAKVHALMRPLLLTLGDHRNLTPNGIKRLSYLTLLFPTSFNEKLCEQLLAHIRKLLEVTVSQGGKFDSEVEKMSALVSMFHQIPAATSKWLDKLSRVVFQTEQQLQIEASSPFRQPLLKFLLRFPNETILLFLNDANIKEQQWSRYLEYVIKQKEGEPIREILQNSTSRLIEMAKGISVNGTPLAEPERSEIVHQSIRLTFVLSRLNEEWLSEQALLIETLLDIWCSAGMQAVADSTEYWQQPHLLVKILLRYFCKHTDNINLLFQLLRAFCGRFMPDFYFLRDFLETTVAPKYSVDWKRRAFFLFVDLFVDPLKNGQQPLTQELKAKILQYIIIPCFSHSFEIGEGETLIGSPAAPEQDNSDNVVSVFISQVIDPENPFGNTDSVRILLLQFSCLLVEQASPHIHDAANKRQGSKLRRLMTFAWPCLLGKNCVDPATRYHGHLLLSHIIAKFAIHKRIVLQVFHSLLKAHALEAKSVVKQALEILTPAMPVRMEDGNTMLTHWTKKIIVEEGHLMPQLYHILQLVVRHYKVYYPVRHHLVQYMVTSIQKLGFSPTLAMEHRKLAVELAEVVIKWELQRIKDETCESASSPVQTPAVIGEKRPASQSDDEPPRKRHTSGTSGPLPKPFEGSSKQIDKVHADAILNVLLRLACQITESQGSNASTSGQPSQGEILSRRCVALFKTALKPEVWFHVDLRIAWIDKLLANANLPQPTGNSNNMGNPNISNICTALEMLTYLLMVFNQDQILATFKYLQKGLNACMTCTNYKVIRLVHGLLSRLMSVFPTEPATSQVASQHDELNGLYASVSRVIHEGLETFDKNQNAPISSLFGVLMLLKAACISNVCYVDRLISLSMRVLQRITRDHLASLQQPQASGGDSSPVANEMLIVSLDLLKGRVGVMGQEMRKNFIGTILSSLIEKSNDSKVMKAIIKMMEEWIKSKDPQVINQGPSLREKSILLTKLVANVEKRFSDEQDLIASFLEIINFIYRDESLKQSELVSKLEQAFMYGLRCNQPAIRMKFFEVFDASVKKRLYDRMLYIITSQNWESMGPHYWIKQCVELLLTTALPDTEIRTSCTSIVVPGVNSAMVDDRSSLLNVKEEPVEAQEERFEELDFEIGDDDLRKQVRTDYPDRRQAIRLLVTRQIKTYGSWKEIKTAHFLSAAAHLCHFESSLAEKVWLELFPRAWKIISDKQQASLQSEMVPFLSSGAHVSQRDCQPSALNALIESVALCDPPIPIKPALMTYLAKTHNLWHRMALNLERLAFDPVYAAKMIEEKPGDCYDFEPTPGSALPQKESMDALSDLYWNLCEEDLWAGLWQKHAHFKETSVAIAWEQQGYFEQAQATYEGAMKLLKDEKATSTPQAQASIQREVALWEKHWIRCTKELNQWEQLLEYGKSNVGNNAHLLLESSWRVPDWALMKECLLQVDQNCPKELQWQLHLYKGYLAVCNTEDQHLGIVDRHVENASANCMKEWRRLPRVVSHIHLPLLQAAQLIMELQEAAQIHQGFHHTRPNSLHDMKAIVKTWRNRLPVVADNLSHWGDVFTWRQHQFSFISNHFSQGGEGNAANNHSIIGAHSSASAIITFGKIARKHGLVNVCINSLSRIYTIPSVPVMDCFQKIRQQTKCHLQTGGPKEQAECLDLIEGTNLSFFTKDMVAEFYAIKGLLLTKSNRQDEANKAFSASVQLFDTLAKGWSLWGDYLEGVFAQQKEEKSLGVAAIACYLNACRHQTEQKSRKYLAKVLWLLSYDDSHGQLAEAIEKYSGQVPPLQWLAWIPQLLTCLVTQEGKVVLNLLSQVGKMFPQAVYFPIRTLYLTLKIEQREHVKWLSTDGGDQKTAASKATGKMSNRLVSCTLNSDTNCLDGGSSTSQADTKKQGDTMTIRATPPMWRCSRIMHMQREIHPTVLASLEGIVDQLVWFRESWYEEVLRQLRQGLAKCYTLAYEGRLDVNDTKITPHTLNFVRKLSSTFGIGEVQNTSASGSNLYSGSSDSLAKRTLTTIQDPVFHKMKEQFRKEFEFSAPETMGVHNLINKLKKWIKTLESKAKVLPKSLLIEERCRFLSNFCQQTAEVELPGELLLPRHAHYYVRIARFMPKVEVVHKHNAAARRLYLRGHNGKIYPYLIVNDSGLGEARREERVLQLLRLLNLYLGKKKETSRRFLHITVPRVVPVAPQMRLVEDNPHSLALISIFKQKLASKGLDPDSPIAQYYDKLKALQNQGQQASHQMLLNLMKEIQNTMAPPDILKEWALSSFPQATEYWTFRKMFTGQLALAGLMEYVLHLTRLNPDMIYIHQDTGLINVAYYRFDLDDNTGELVAQRAVPLRLTPALSEFITQVGINGPLTASMVAAARCLAQPSYKIINILRAILRDEMISWHKKSQMQKKPDERTIQDNNMPPPLDGEQLVATVSKAANDICKRLNLLANLETPQPSATGEALPHVDKLLSERVGQIISAASSPLNLCRMDPAWHPWL